jgi:cytochrome c peroxidase
VAGRPTAPARAQQAAPDPELIARGRALFNDPSLSLNDKWSCAACHPGEGHTDNRTYVGLKVVPHGDPLGRSTPTLWGVGTRAAITWAGTAPSLASNIHWTIVDRMKGAEPSPETVAALVAYVTSLTYPSNPHLNADGSPSASAPAAARRGYALFRVKAGCSVCHQPPAYDKKDVEDVGSGGRFKVPSLRVVALTAPYFHDGRFATLDEAVRFMWDYVRRAGTTETLTDDDLRDIVEFLRIL